eukprot:1142975-Pelagomonas_calceolata.AAC.4
MRAAGKRQALFLAEGACRESVCNALHAISAASHLSIQLFQRAAFGALQLRLLVTGKEGF